MITYPKYPCRELETRACPKSYGDVCGDRPCARYESEDETPWAADAIELITRGRRDRDG